MQADSAFQEQEQFSKCACLPAWLVQESQRVGDGRFCSFCIKALDTALYCRTIIWDHEHISIII